MNARQRVVEYNYRMPKNADPEAYEALQETFNKLNEFFNSPVPSNVDPNNYSRKIVVQSNVRNKNPNGMFRLFTANSGMYSEPKNIFRLFQR